jgi:lipoprotein NlpI
MKHTTSLLIVLSIIGSSVACGGDSTATPEPSASGLTAGNESSAQTEWKPSTELCSADHEYCVKIIAKAQDLDHRELIISSKTRVLAQFPTFGYLMDAFWSPDNKYVAVNNRRANAGDYLWVISLSDGAALKMPDDLATEIGKKNLGHMNGDDPWGKTVREVTTRFTECAHDRLDHRFLFAQGWKSAGDLLVVEELQFSNEPPQNATITAPGPGGVTRSVTATVGYYGPGAPGIWIAVNKACRVTGNKIALKGQTIEKHEHSSEFVNRAWTYGAYWMQSPAEDFFTSAQAKQAKGDLDGAIADYSRSIELAPKNPYAYYSRGNAKGAEGDLDGAIADYSRALELDPKNVYAYNNRGLTKQSKGDVDGAIADYNRTLELDPKNAYAYNNRGLAKDAKGDYDGAIADCNRAIELDSKYAKSYRNRGVAKEAKGDVDGAIADYNRAIEFDPKYADAYNNRASARQAKGDPDSAIADYNRVIELVPKYADAYNNRGLANALLRNWADALADYRRFCELSESGQDYPRLSIWLIRARLGETEAASKELSTYFDKRPKATPSDWFSKVAGHLLGKVSEADLFAAAASPDAKQDSEQHCEAWFYAGMKKLFSGDKETAANYFRKCLATKQKDFTEFQLAQSELKALGK